MSVLITGSAGHLGEAIARKLAAAGAPGRGVDLKESPFTDHVGSLCDPAFVRRCMQGADAVIHAATLHKPHVATHSMQQFIETNVTASLVLLEAAVAAGVNSFVFTSSTSVFGAALAPAPDRPAAWITEDVVPVPKNIYGATKLMAESLCELFHRRQGLPVVVLRTSRFFPEDDDNPAVRKHYELANVQANEMLYRRVDMEDAATAHLLALEKAPGLGFRRYIISATTPFSAGDLAKLRRNAPEVVRSAFPECDRLYAARGWRLFPEIDRIYVNARARSELGWQPKYDFGYVLDCLRTNTDFRSSLAKEVGSKGYHDVRFADGPYPIA
jgi:UDP-glucose 4-epimerase